MDANDILRRDRATREAAELAYQREVRAARLAHPLVTDEQRCTCCNGRGWVDTQDDACAKCGGNGYAVAP